MKNLLSKLTGEQAFSACATDADIARWEAAGRKDILAWVEPIAVVDASDRAALKRHHAPVSS